MFSALRYKIIDLARGTDSISLLKALRQWQYESHEQLQAREKTQLATYFDAMRSALPLFRDVEQFSDLPVLDKRFINTHSEQLRNPHYKGKVIRKKTGGSTGEPLVYYSSTESQSYLWAGIFLAWEAAGFQLGDKVAFLAGSSLFGNGYKQRIYYRLLNVSVLSAFDMSPQRMDDYNAALSNDNFRLLYGYASAIHRLARHRLASGTRTRHALRGIVCTAEVLTPSMRADIEAAFGVPCYSQYGCNEAGVSAFECEHRDGMHLISTRSHTEVMPDGRLIATDMANQAMFLPRCDTGDLVRMTGRLCACGRGLPLIDEVGGRQNDMVLDPHGAAVHSEFFTHLFREDAQIHSFQVVFDTQRLEINLHGNCSEGNLALNAHYRDRIQASLAFAQLDFVYNAPFLLQANGKHRFVLRRPSA